MPMKNDPDVFMQHLQDIRSSLVFVVQSAEIGVLINCDYERRISLPDALSAVQSAIDAWEDCQHEFNLGTKTALTNRLAL
jgi:hypothetical protein